MEQEQNEQNFITNHCAKFLIYLDLLTPLLPSSSLTKSSHNIMTLNQLQQLGPVINMKITVDLIFQIN